ncbi:hypothetical protein F0562_013241 [Nyssa sinensis]|uniref:Uncharacterized protein n=1 Tax=Nyssa sinensis TaxID=561372 RepID=A0A5J4ZXH0_9ASTE|nr:hypothetical protein F0562_013241 [Nyssa sinensis]
MSGLEPHSELDVPPGFSASARGSKPSSPVPSNVRPTATGGGSPPAFPAKSPNQPISQALVCKDHQSEPPPDSSGNSRRVTRKKSQPISHAVVCEDHLGMPPPDSSGNSRRVLRKRAQPISHAVVCEDHLGVPPPDSSGNSRRVFRKRAQPISQAVVCGDHLGVPSHYSSSNIHRVIRKRVQPISQAVVCEDHLGVSSHHSSGNIQSVPRKRAHPISQAVVCEDHQGAPSHDSSGNSPRVARKRAKPQFFDPTPLPKRKRRRGRPPGSGRKPRLGPWFGPGEPVIGRDSRAPVTRLRKQFNSFIHPSVWSEENQSSFPTQLQLGEQSINTNTAPIIHQHTEQPIPNKKMEPQDVAGNGQPSVVGISTACSHQETTTIPPLREVASMANVSQREGACVLNTQSSQSIDAFMRHVANAFDDSGESNPAADGMKVQVGSYAVNPTLAPTLEAIINKHGDIAKDCPLKSGYMRTSLLEGVCNVVQELQRKEFTELDSSSLLSYYSALKDAQTMKLNVKWLHQRLDEIYYSVKSVVHAKNLTDQKTIRMERIECMKKDLQLNKVELEKLKSEIEAKESQLALETMENLKLNNAIRGMTSKFQHFQNNSLMDGLL